MGWKDAPVVSPRAKQQPAWASAPVVGKEKPKPEGQGIMGRLVDALTGTMSADAADRHRETPEGAADVARIEAKRAEAAQVARAETFRKQLAIRDAHGVVDRGQALLARGTASFDAGLSRLVGNVGRARNMEAIAGTALPNETTWDTVKNNPSAAGIGKFILEQGTQSLPGMGAVVVSPLSYVASQTGNIGQQRAVSDGRDQAGGGDFLAAAPAAVASAALERLGVEKILFPGAGNFLVRTLKAAGAEGATEFAQSGVEYAGGSVGTDKGFDLGTALDQSLAGLVAGLGTGGALHAATDAPRALNDNRLGAQALAEAFRLEAAPEALPAPLVPVPANDPQPELAPRQVEPAAPAWANAPEVPMSPEAAPTSPKADTQPVAVAPGDGLGMAAPLPSEPVPATAPVEPGRSSIPAQANPAPPLPTAAPIAAPQELQDGESYIRTPAGAKVRTRGEVVDASTLAKAEGAFQNRDRTRETTDLQVQDIIAKFDPELLGNDPSSDRGGPVVGQDNTVYSGNGRMLALNRIFDEHPEKAEAYRRHIESLGHSTEGIERPVFVRRITQDMTPDELRAFVVDSNKDTKLEMTPTERARSDADSITGDLLAKYAGGDLNSSSNRGFIESFAKRLTAAEMGNFIGSDRRLTQAGLDRVENAVIAAAYDSPRLLERIMENPVDDIRAISGSLADVAPRWAAMKKRIDAGELEPQYDIIEALTDAAERISHARKQGTKIGDLLSQEDAFNPIPPAAAELIRAFYNADMTRPASKKAVTTFLADYIDLANDQAASQGLFGDEPPRPALSLLKGLLSDRDKPNGDGLFDALDDTPQRASVPGRRAGPERPARASRYQAALDTSDDETEAPMRPKLSQGEYAPTFLQASFTDRASVFDVAAEAVGLDSDRFRLLPAPRQVALLQRAMIQRFGIQVNVDKGMQERFAIDQMLDAFQNVQGMAHVLDLPSRAMSFGGKLNLTLQKSGNFLGRFQAGTNNITLPKRSNSFAHEWGHALDWHLLELTEGDGRGLSGAIRKEGDDIGAGELPSDIRGAFVALLNAMFFDKASAAERIMQLEAKLAATKGEKTKAQVQAQIDRLKDGSSQARGIRTAFYKDAKAFEGEEKDYWTSPTEMLARSFEAYTSYKVEAAGLTTEFIGKGDANYLAGAGERFEKTFPKGDERAAIFAAYDHLFGKLSEAQILEPGNRAERPGATVTKITDYDRTPQVKRERGIIARELAGIRNATNQAKKEKAGRADDFKSWREKSADLNGALFMSMTGNLRMIQGRSGSKALQQLIDLLTKQDGKGDRTVSRTFSEDVHIRSKQGINRLANILKANGAANLDVDDTRLLRDLLTEADAGTVDVPPGMGHIVKAAAGIRHLLDNEFYENQRAGIDLGYTRNGYLSRVLDLPKVWNDQPAFVADATKVYEIVFDNAFGSAEAVLANEETLARFMKLARSLDRKGHDLPSLGEVQSLLKDDAEGDEVVEALAALLDEARPAFAQDRAEAWLSSINLVAGEEHNAPAPDSQYTKHRQLPPEADKLMEKFYLSDPVEAVTNYLTASARRTAYAKRFGHDGARRKALFESMAKQGVNPDDQRTVERILDTATGRRRSELPKSVQNSLSVVNAAGVMALLPRATLSSLAEPFTAGIVTGDAMDGFKMVGMMVGSALGSPSGKARYELARAMGIVSDMAADGIMENRYGQTFADQTRADRFVATMFRRTGLTPLTRAQKTAGVGLGHAFLDNLAQQIVGKSGQVRTESPNGGPGIAAVKTGKAAQDAIALMRELGIRDPEAFSTEMIVRGRLPSVEDLETPFGQDYTTAQLRFSDMIVQNPSAMDRPELSQNPVGRVIYGITGFSYAYWRNVMKRSANRIREIAKRDGPGAALYFVRLLAAAATAYLMAATVSTIRERLLNPKRWHELEAKGELESTMLQLGFTRTFSFGVADTAINTWTGLKYQRDLSNVFVGPGPGFFLQNAQKVAGLARNNSRKTNTAEYNASQGLYSAASPFLAFGLARIPGGPVTDIATGVGMAYVTSAAARDEFATAVAGRKHGSIDPETGKKTKSGPTGYDELLDATLGEKKRKKAGEP